ncbi:MAG: MAPEG family protein [Oleiphilaceae bacterium]|nr:MAPEG family protein [Oleiphilaceae bacterium]
MEHNLIFYPVVAQIILTFVMYARLPVLKKLALEKGEVDLERRALHNDAWPDYVLKVSNNVQNQFESPVLFYALAFMLWALETVTFPALVLAWAYVSLRIVHMLVHTGANVVPVRKNVFIVSVLMLMGLCALVIHALLVAS